MEKIQEIIVATQNAGKVKEISQAMRHLPIKVLSLADCGTFPEPIENGGTFEENALLKARYYAALTGKPCLADDSGLEVDSLGKAPGVYSARYAGEHATDKENNHKLLQALAAMPEAKRTGRFRCVLALVESGDLHGFVLTTEGVCEGEILQQPRGEHGFGYDPLFFMPKLNKTLAEVTVEEKNQISHRGQALGKLVDKLQEYLK
ncbi:XTP/dITP diphosphohydrolase [Sporomusaceae bacterium BoRhaA]|uniref:XTP/dITP diphosphatase n=1 Tax=Pelorhabdus rhamnosifermentans TaxID=2772457 RepID=UPI002484ACE8|nr:XTP/dITP diphosphohydrolase [Pelorhabdus rhamnosifermentans]